MMPFSHRFFCLHTPLGFGDLPPGGVVVLEEFDLTCAAALLSLFLYGEGWARPSNRKLGLSDRQWVIGLCIRGRESRKGRGEKYQFAFVWFPEEWHLTFSVLPWLVMVESSQFEAAQLPRFHNIYA